MRIKNIERFVFSSPYSAALLAGLSLLGICFAHTAADPDLFARIAIGRLIATTGEIPRVDPFGFTPRNPAWIDHEWLSGLVFYYLSQHGGDASLFWFKLAIAGLSIAVLGLAAREGGLSRTYFVLIFLPMVLLISYVWRSTIRAQVFTYLFFPWVLYSIVRVYSGCRLTWIYTLPLVFALWANFHGGFVLGLLVLGIVTICELFQAGVFGRPLLGTLLLSLFATLCNPYGVHYWFFLAHALSMPRPYISEWAAVQLFSPIGIVLWVTLAIALPRFRFAEREKLGFAATLTIIIFFVLALLHLRLAAPFVMVVIVFGARTVSHSVECLMQFFGEWTSAVERGILVALMAIYLLLSIEAVNNRQGLGVKLSLAAFPAGIIETLRQSDLGGNLLVDFNNGSFALWRLYPKFRVAVDGRYEEVYPQETFDRVRCALDVNCAEMNTSVDEIHPDVILYALQNSREKFKERLGEGWRVVFENSEGIIFVPQSSPVQMLPPALPSGSIWANTW